MQTTFLAHVYYIRVKTCGQWRIWRKVFTGRAAARREALRLAYDCGFTWDNVEVI